MDHFPSPGEIMGAQMNWERGVATCEDMEILRLANPQSGMYSTPCDCVGDFLSGIFDCNSWPF